MTRVLLLTQGYVPHQLISWERAIVLWFRSKVEVIEEYAEELRSPSLSLKMPAVVRLLRPIGDRKHKRAIKFSRRNLFTRDGFRCQYCGLVGLERDLTFDHVIPRRLGGKTTWENIVAACQPCNWKKGHRGLEQAGMRLMKKPTKPTWLPLAGLITGSTKADCCPLWAPYLAA